LDMSTGAFQNWVYSGPDDPAISSLFPPIFRADYQLSKKRMPTLEEARSVLYREPIKTEVRSDSAHPLSKWIMPIERGSAVIAVISVLLGTESHSRQPPSLEQINYWSIALALIRERRFSMRLFNNLPKPTDVATSETEYLEHLALLTYESAKMQFLAVRELDSKSQDLNAIVVWGFEGTALDKFDLSPTDPDVETFYQALADGRAICIDSHAESCPNLLKDANRDIRSFVVAPIMVGTQPFGTLSLATSIEYNYSETERLGFETIASSLGTAISNYRHFHEAMENLANTREFSKAITAVELAQAARHEARVIVDTLQTRLANVLEAIKKGKYDLATKYIDDFSAQLASITGALDRIRDAQMAPVRDASLEEDVSLKAVFHEARQYALGTLNKERIDCRFEGPDYTIKVSHAWLRNAFVNLILNSVEAYKTATKGSRKQRYIKLRTSTLGQKASTLRFVYQDDAGGINVASLSRPSERHSEMPVQRLIFERSVTSKANGTGYGLYIVRRVFSDLDGSIELTQHRSGVTFEISIPRERVVT
jgi:signal transduction histidine kinase